MAGRNMPTQIDCAACGRGSAGRGASGRCPGGGVALGKRASLRSACMSQDRETVRDRIAVYEAKVARCGTDSPHPAKESMPADRVRVAVCQAGSEPPRRRSTYRRGSARAGRRLRHLASNNGIGYASRALVARIARRQFLHLPPPCYPRLDLPRTGHHVLDAVVPLRSVSVEDHMGNGAHGPFGSPEASKARAYQKSRSSAS